MKPAVEASQAGKLFDPRLFGACGDGERLDTPALQAAVDACAQGGGGTVFLAAGRYLTGTLYFRDNVTLHLDAGAVLLGSQDPGDYPVTPNRWEGSEQSTHAPLIAGSRLHDISIVGQGTIDGQGDFWWKAFKGKTLDHPRPRLIGFNDCSNVLIEGVRLVNSPSWTVNPVRCRNVRVSGITIVNPPDSPNTDGINPDSCQVVRISDCFVSVGDDCITIKSGTQHEKPENQSPCRDIAITNCTLERGHGGVVIGSEMSGDVRNVVISNCIFVGTDRGIRLKSRRGRGGVVEDVRVSNLIMDGVLCPLTINLYYGCGAWGDEVVSDKNARPVDDGTPRFRHIALSHITARDVKYAAGFIYGLAEMPVEDVSLMDVSITLSEGAGAAAGYPEMADGIPQMQQAGFYVRNAHRLRLERVEVAGQVGPAFHIIDSRQVELSACATPVPAADAPVVLLENVSDAFLQGCRAAPGTEVFLQVAGPGTGGIVLDGNALSSARRPLDLRPDVPPGAVEGLS